MKSTIESMEVVNDCADRRIKDIQEYADASNDEHQREKIIGVVSWHRAIMATYSNKDMEDNI